MPRANIPKPSGHWGPRVYALIEAKNWLIMEAVKEFGCGWCVIKGVIQGKDAKIRFVRQLLKLEKMYAHDLKVCVAAKDREAGRITRDEYIVALQEWVDVSNRQVRPRDLDEVGVVGATDEEGNRPVQRFQPVVFAYPERRNKRKRDQANVSGRPEDPDGGSDGIAEGPAA